MLSVKALGVCLAALACLVAAAGIVQGLRCGIMSGSSRCTPTGCTAYTQRCVSYVHPFLPPLLVAGLIGIITAWRRMPLATITLGVVAAFPSTLSGLSLGFWGIGVAWLLVAAGLAIARPPHAFAYAGLAAAIAPYPLFMIAAISRLPPGLAVGLMATPSALWIAAITLVRLRPREPPRTTA